MSAGASTLAVHLNVIALTALLVGASASAEDARAVVHANCSPPLDKSQAALPCLSAYRRVQLRPGQNSGLALGVAISGGGYRAANFAMGVLLALEDLRADSGANALAEVDYLSTVSGGGLAAAAYIAALHQFQQGTATSTREFSLADVMTPRDGGAAHRLRANLYPYLWRAMLPRLGRNEALHNRFEEHVPGLTLGDLFVPNCEDPVVEVNRERCQSSSGGVPRLPYWIANATIAKDGAIFPFTPDILAYREVTGYRHRQDIQKTPYEMPLSVGMTASATFPGGIPPLTLCVRGECGRRSSNERSPDQAELQLLDGGAADNLGVLTALTVLAQDEARKKVLIVIDAYVGSGEPLQTFRDRLSTLNVLRRATTISLDSWRSRHRRVVGAMTKGLSKPGDKWNVVFLTFDDLRAADKKLHEAVHSIGTNFKISEAQQKQLLAAGKLAVHTRRAELCDALRWQ